jgi:hypothetical protein
MKLMYRKPAAASRHRRDDLAYLVENFADLIFAENGNIAMRYRQWRFPRGHQVP